jgi:hypothetical protein
MKIDKDPSIIDLLERLDLHKRNWRIQDHWEADLSAIGISNPPSGDSLVYVSTFFLKAGRYHCECEKRSRNSAIGYETVHESRNLTFEELVRILEKYLDHGV